MNLSQGLDDKINHGTCVGSILESPDGILVNTMSSIRKTKENILLYAATSIIKAVDVALVSVLPR